MSAKPVVKQKSKKNKDLRRFKSDDIFPNMFNIGGLNYQCQIGSFSKDVSELSELALRSMKKLKDMEERK